MNTKKIKGFTLIEMMIVVAILGIVSAIAVPSYTEYVKKGKRTDGKVELLRIAQLQESYFVQNLSYASTLAQLGLTGTVKSEQETYEITIDADDSGGGDCTGSSADSCTAFTLTATPLGGQASDKCKEFTLTHAGAKGNPSAVTGYNANKCWK